MTEPDDNAPDPSAGLEQKQSRLLSHAMTDAGITTGDLWLRYFSIGGYAGEYEVDAYIQSILSLPPSDRDLLAHAANELIDELPPRARAPYLEDLKQTGPASEHQEPRQRHQP
jgi:hypothetical protein